MRDTVFLDERRLLTGPWQAFERDVARALIAAGFSDVRIIGGSGDRGGDILTVKDGKVWVVQCKHTTLSSPPTQEPIPTGSNMPLDPSSTSCTMFPGESSVSPKSAYSP